MTEKLTASPMIKQAIISSALIDYAIFFFQYDYVIPPNQQCIRVPIVPTAGIVILSTFAKLEDLKFYAVVLICISLIVNEVEHFPYVR